MALRVFLVLLFLALPDHSSAIYCLCKNGVGTQSLQKAIDYACANGADCTPIQQNGPCYLPNTVQDHCNYAVNSFYQRKVSSGGTCDFSGAATTSSAPPSTASSGCVYPSSPSNGTTTPPTGGGTPGTPPTGGGTPGTPPSITPPSGITPGTSPSITPPTGTTPGTGTGTGTPGSPNVFGLSPTSSTGNGGGDGNGAVVAALEGTWKLLLPLVLTTLCLALRI